MKTTDNLDYKFIQQYLNGELDSRQMHELEKRALEDPFLSEALEGYASVNKSQEFHLNILKKRLEVRLKPNELERGEVLLTWQRLSIAAVGLLILISAAVLFWMKDSPSESLLAVQDEPVEQQAATPDSLSGAGDLKEARLGKEGRLNEELYTDTETKKAATNKIIPAAPESALKANEEPKEESMVLAGSVKQESPVDMTARAGEAAAGVQTYSRSSAATLKMSAAGPADSLKANPVVGYDVYKEYIQNQARIMEGFVKGMVTLAFKLDADGRPVNIRLVKGLNAAQNEEAIRLLQSGPSWRYVKEGEQDEIVYSVQFNK